MHLPTNAETPCFEGASPHVWRSDIGFVRLLRIEVDIVVVHGPATVPSYLDLETGEQNVEPLASETGLTRRDQN
jgi:hypothetical protein